MITTNLLTVGKWHHVAATWNGATTFAALYLDGVQIGSATTAGSSGSLSMPRRWQIGTDVTGGGRLFPGSFYRVAGYDKEFSPTEVAEQFAGSSPVVPPGTEANPINFP